MTDRSGDVTTKRTGLRIVPTNRGQKTRNSPVPGIQDAASRFECAQRLREARALQAAFPDVAAMQSITISDQH
jgi:hypothetical protein